MENSAGSSVTGRARQQKKVLCFFLSRKKFFSEEKNQKTFPI
jgi:hypothetical protein